MDIIFTQDPDRPDLRLVEIQDGNGRSIQAGEWIKYPNGQQALRINDAPAALQQLHQTLRMVEAALVVESIPEQARNRILRSVLYGTPDEAAQDRLPLIRERLEALKSAPPTLDAHMTEVAKLATLLTDAIRDRL